MNQNFKLRLETLKLQVADNADFLGLVQVVKMSQNSATLALTDVENAVVTRVDIQINVVFQPLCYFG